MALALRGSVDSKQLHNLLQAGFSNVPTHLVCVAFVAATHTFVRRQMFLRILEKFIVCHIVKLIILLLYHHVMSLWPNVKPHTRMRQTNKILFFLVM